MNGSIKSILYREIAKYDPEAARRYDERCPNAGSVSEDLTVQYNYWLNELNLLQRDFNIPVDNALSYLMQPGQVDEVNWIRLFFIGVLPVVREFGMPCDGIGDPSYSGQGRLIHEYYHA